MGFKQDEDFLRFLTMGAVGSASVADYLTRKHGHEIVELERYTMSNKLWSTKVKRLRLPDLMCLRCGIRIEARAKSKLEIKVSHSERPDREWDAGLRDRDLIAFVYCRLSDGTVIPSARPQCFTVGSMRLTAHHARLGPPKSAADGAERDLTWPSSVPKRPGRVIAVDPDGRNTVVALMDGGRRQSYSLRVPAYAYVDEGDLFPGDEVFLIGCVAPVDTLDCPGPVWDREAGLHSKDSVELYAAVKATGLSEATTSELERLGEIAHGAIDVRIALEALGALARHVPDNAIPELVGVALLHNSDAPMAMEAIFILSELGNSPGSIAAASALATLAADDVRLGSEARAAAVWGLGISGLQRYDLVVQFLADADDVVALHAVAALGTLDEPQLQEVATLLGGSSRQAAAAVAVLLRQGDAGAALLLEAVGQNPAWALYGLGQLSPERVRRVAGGSLPTELENLLEPMWQGSQDNWLSEPDNQLALRLLLEQTLKT